MDVALPTTRLMQFSPAGGREETITEDGARSVQPLRGFSSAHFLKLIEDRGQVGFWSSELNSGNTTVSVGLYRVLGIDPSIALRYEDLFDITHPDDLQTSHDMKAALRSGFATEREFRIIRPDGKLRWINSKAEVIVDGAGRPSRAVGVITDITDRYSARQFGDEGWARYKVLMKSMSAIEFRSTPDGDVLDWSGWFELTGQSEEKARAQGWLELVHPEDRARVRALLATSFNTGKTHASTHRILCADGRYHWCSTYYAPLVDTDGSIREWVGAIVNTEGHNADQSLSAQAEGGKLKGSHVRAARALLNWTVEDLAREAGISVSSVSRLEAPDGNSVRNVIIQSVRKAFMDYGVTFTHRGTNAISLHFDSEQARVS